MRFAEWLWCWAACACLSHGFLLAQAVGNPQSRGVAPPGSPEIVSSPFAGKWTYRSFRSNPDLAVEPNELLFGRGTLELSHPAPDRVSGTLGGNGWQLALTGGATNGDPASIRFQGKGKIGGEEWVYDYLGYLIPVWPQGESQRSAIVGTIVRTVPHSDGQGGTSPAGAVAQWIAVKQDEPAGGSSRMNAALEPIRAKDGSQPLLPAARGVDAEQRVMWALKDPRGQTRHAKEFRGKPTVIVLSMGFECVHCAEQINVFSKNEQALRSRGVHVVFVVSESDDALRAKLGSLSTPHVFLADPECEAFRAYGSYGEAPLHGVIIEDASGRIRWKAIGPAPWTDMEAVLAAIDRTTAQDGRAEGDGLAN